MRSCATSDAGASRAQMEALIKALERQSEVITARLFNLGLQCRRRVMYGQDVDLDMLRTALQLCAAFDTMIMQIGDILRPAVPPTPDRERSSGT